jgi:arginyl-tRNA synthetase
MIAWQMFGNGATPESTGVKGDHLVGEYYVKFNDVYKEQVAELIAAGKTKDEAEKEAPIMKATQQMLLDWEDGKPEVMELWKTMNGWVYAGFDVTYNSIGADFDKTYYESNTYLLGKDIVQQGMDKKVFYQKEDSSIWIDLTADGLDEKIVQRSDGTSVYITQDIGLALQKYEQYKINQSIYVIGNEQNYHMKVLQLICQKLGMPNADNIYHLSYGMVELTSGKMKSREGTVVDADDIVEEMITTSQQHTEELGKVKDFTAEELTTLYNTIGLGAMKFYLLRVDPKKTMVFNPAESIDFHGFTGPFVQYTHARIKSILRKQLSSEQLAVGSVQMTSDLLKAEKEVIVVAEQYGSIIEQAAQEHNPSVIANYVFNLAKTFNSFYSELSVANAETESKKQLRLKISLLTANVLKSGMSLLGINVPERM